MENCQVHFFSRIYLHPSLHPRRYPENQVSWENLKRLSRANRLLSVLNQILPA